MPRVRIEEFMGDLNHGFREFVKEHKFANDADIFTFVEKTVKEALTHTIGEVTDTLFAVVNPERPEETFDYKGKSLMVFTCQQLPINEVMITRLRGGMDPSTACQPGATDEDLIISIDFEEVETIKMGDK